MKCSKLYEQQKQMYENKTHQVPGRIVSIHQPWVRPIVRGKATADVKFGVKVAISVVGGYTRMENLNWDAYKCRDEHREAGEWNEVEGKFGTGKRCYGLDRLTARLKSTCETQIHMIVMTMNLWKRLRNFLRQNCRLISQVIWKLIYAVTTRRIQMAV